MTFNGKTKTLLKTVTLTGNIWQQKYISCNMSILSALRHIVQQLKREAFYQTQLLFSLPLADDHDE